MSTDVAILIFNAVCLVVVIVNEISIRRMVKRIHDDEWEDQRWLKKAEESSRK